MAEGSQSQQKSDAPDGGGVAESSQSQQKSDAPNGVGGKQRLFSSTR